VKRGRSNFTLRCSCSESSIRAAADDGDVRRGLRGSCRDTFLDC
jgi:hypothetical protein